MAIAPLMRNTVLLVKGEQLRMLRPFEDGLWQLENVHTGRISEMSLDVLHEHIRLGDAQILLSEETDKPKGDRASRSQSQRRWETLPDSHKDIARRRQRYVLATINCARSRGVVESEISNVAKATHDENAPCFSSVMNWVASYIKGGRDICSLAPRYNNRGAKPKVESDVVEQIVDQQIDEHYLTRERPSLEETREHIAALIERRNKNLPIGDPRLPIPALRYLRTRLAKRAPYDVCCARFGKEYAAKKYQTVLGFVHADRPLERVEVDHTVLDLMVIDDKTGLPLGRPTLTVAIDINSRAALGYYLGFEPPSYLAVARCMRHAILPKSYLKSRYPEIKGTWPCHGAWENAVVDNGLEFHSKAFEDAAARFGTDIQYCPRAKPWFKGTVERFIGTMNRGVAHGKPGTTFSNIFERDDYDPKKTSVITLSVLHELIHTWIIDYYHNKVHSSIHKKPVTAWTECTENMPIPLPVALEDFEAAFAVPKERRLDKSGIQLNCIIYNSQACSEYRLKYQATGKAKIRYVPDNLGHIYLEDVDTGEVAKIPATAKFAEYATGLTLWQHKVCRSYALQHFESDDITALGEAKLRIAELVRQAVNGKKLAKRAARYATAGTGSNEDIPPATPPKPSSTGKKSVLTADKPSAIPQGAAAPLPSSPLAVTRIPRGSKKSHAQ